MPAKESMREHTIWMAQTQPKLLCIVVVISGGAWQIMRGTLAYTTPEGSRRTSCPPRTLQITKHMLERASETLCLVFSEKKARCP
jgi:hypothetical protein